MAGLAVRVSQVLGLHVDSSQLVKEGTLTAEMYRDRVRTFWEVYTWDKYVLASSSLLSPFSDIPSNTTDLFSADSGPPTPVVYGLRRGHDTPASNRRRRRLRTLAAFRRVVRQSTKTPLA
jgi:hypothetical protein